MDCSFLPVNPFRLVKDFPGRSMFSMHMHLLCALLPDVHLLHFYPSVKIQSDEHLKPEGGWHPQEAMTREEALRSYTNWAAYAAFEEQLKGSIEPGKLADFVVIDRDYMKCPEEEIKDICSLQTVVGGEVVYETK